MSWKARHVLDFKGADSKPIGAKQIRSFFSKVDSLPQQNLPSNSHLIAHLFFEPSTRTQLSFNTATIRCGSQPLNFSTSSSSMQKGETFLDTLLTVQAMNVSAMVIRHGFHTSLSDIASEIKVPMINAGEGTTGHPTQALLDAYTILKERNNIENEKVLFIGDVKHSRVAHSNFELLGILGSKIGVCGPDSWLPVAEKSGFEFFGSLKEGLGWSTVCMGLRVQKERHDKNFEVELKDFTKRFQLSRDTLQFFRKDGLILHPGPFNREIEITSEVLNDPRCKIWKQVENGVRVRTALLAEVLGLL